MPPVRRFIFVIGFLSLELMVCHLLGNGVPNGKYDHGYELDRRQTAYDYDRERRQAAHNYGHEHHRSHSGHKREKRMNMGSPVEDRHHHKKHHFWQHQSPEEDHHDMKHRWWQGKQH